MGRTVARTAPASATSTEKQSRSPGGRVPYTRAPSIDPAASGASFGSTSPGPSSAVQRCVQPSPPTSLPSSQASGGVTTPSAQRAASSDGSASHATSSARHGSRERRCTSGSSGAQG